MSRRALAALAVVLSGCGTEQLVPSQPQKRSVSLTQFTQPCTARNPILLADATLERRAGPPNSLAMPFSLPFAAPVCVRVEVPDVNGHRVTSGSISLNSEALLDSSDFQQDFAGTTFTRALAAGPHQVSMSVASKPGTRVRVRIEVAGPTIDSVTPSYGPTGTLIVVQGEGFVAPLTIRAGDVVLSSGGASNESTLIAASVDSMPVSALTVTTPFGAVTSADVFVPDQPRNVAQFYPLGDFELRDATCSGAASLRIRHDSSRLGFALVDSQPSDSFTLDIDLDREPLTVERQLSSTRSGTTSTVSATFAELGLMSHLTLGHMFFRVRTVGACGVRQSEWVELKSAFAPGFVIVRAAAPTELAARHGLTLVVSEGELSLMQIPLTSTMDDTLVALGRDPESQGAIPDPVLYDSSHRTGASCLVPGQVHDTGLNAMGFPGASQWNLDRIGIVAHPSPLAGVGIVVAVVDTGLATTPDLAGASIPGFDFTIFGDGTTSDVDAPSSTNVGFHGTSVASVIAARQGNGGIVGIAPGATILPLRVMGATGAGDGFALFRAFSRIMTLRPALNIQVVNASMAEFLDSIGLWAGIAARLAGLGGISNVALTAGLVIGPILRSAVSTLHAAGIAVVASAGNVPGCPGGGTMCFANGFIAAAGPQFPANAAGSFAIASTDTANAPSATSMPASVFKEIALAAPVDTAAGFSAVPATIPGGITCFGGTSAAAPQVSGAAAFLLAPPPPLAPAPVGTVALARLMETATPLAAPQTSVGAGLLNLAAASVPPVVWGTDFESLFGRINDMTFMLGVGDFALRGGGSTIESVPSPGGNVSTVVTALPGATWLTSVPSLRVLLVGFAGSVEVRSAGGTLAETRSTPSFRAAVSAVPRILVGELVALGNPDGTVNVVRVQPLRSLVTLTPAVPMELYLDAVWAAEPGASTHETLALRTAKRVEFYRVPIDLAANCSSQPAGCPVRIGSVPLVDSSGPIVPEDWSAVQTASGTSLYVVNGSSSLFIGGFGASALVPTGVGTQTWFEVETAPASTKVFLVDRQAPAMAIVNGTAVVQIDTSRIGVSTLVMNGPLRVAPDATYAYAAGRILRGTASWAVFFGGL